MAQKTHQRVHFCSAWSPMITDCWSHTVCSGLIAGGVCCCMWWLVQQVCMHKISTQQIWMWISNNNSVGKSMRTVDGWAIKKVAIHLILVGLTFHFAIVNVAMLGGANRFGSSWTRRQCHQHSPVITSLKCTYMFIYVCLWS